MIGHVWRGPAEQAAARLHDDLSSAVIPGQGTTDARYGVYLKLATLEVHDTTSPMNRGAGPQVCDSGAGPLDTHRDQKKPLTQRMISMMRKTMTLGHHHQAWCPGFSSFRRRFLVNIVTPS